MADKDSLLTSTDTTSEVIVGNDKEQIDISQISLQDETQEDIAISTARFNNCYNIIVQHIHDCRYLASYEKFVELMKSFDYPPIPVPSSSSSSSSSKKELEQQNEATLNYEKAFFQFPVVSALISSSSVVYDLPTIYTMLERVKEIHETIHYQDDSSEWILGADMFGVKTYYRIDKSDHSMIVKLDGILEDLPVFELCAVMKEVDLFSEWIPFCRESILVDKIGKAELVPYIWLSSPMLGRDFAFRAYAADCTMEHGRIIIVGQSIDEYEAKPIPWKPKGWTQNRMYIKELKNMITILSPTSAKVILSWFALRIAYVRLLLCFFCLEYHDCSC
jgi:cell division protein FtsL